MALSSKANGLRCNACGGNMVELKYLSPSPKQTPSVPEGAISP